MGTKFRVGNLVFQIACEMQGNFVEASRSFSGGGAVVGWYCCAVVGIQSVHHISCAGLLMSENLVVVENVGELSSSENEAADFNSFCLVVAAVHAFVRSGREDKALTEYFSPVRAEGGAVDREGVTVLVEKMIAKTRPHLPVEGLQCFADAWARGWKRRKDFAWRGNDTLPLSGL